MLKGMDILIVRSAVGLRPAEQPDKIGRRIETNDILRQRPVPAGPGNGEPLLSGAGRALPRVGEGFSPCIHELKQIKTPI